MFSLSELISALYLSYAKPHFSVAAARFHIKAINKHSSVAINLSGALRSDAAVKQMEADESASNLSAY